MFIPYCKSSIEISILKSKFIAISLPIINENIKSLIDSIKEEYPKASHYLYAYKFGSVLKSNDDGEPGNIARNFLKCIENNKFDNILIVVVRYFGGTKLGASRLSSTYTNLVIDLLKKIEKYEIIDAIKYSIEVDYSTFNNIKNLGFEVENVQYFDKIKLDIISQINIDDKLLSLGINDFKKERIKKEKLCTQ